MEIVALEVKIVFPIISNYVNYADIQVCNLGVVNQPFYCPDRGCSGLCRSWSTPANPAVWFSQRETS